MSEKKKWFSGDGSKLFWKAINRSKDKDLLYKYGCKAQEMEASHDALLSACELYQERIELFRKTNPSIVIALGSGLGLKQAEDKGKAAIAQGKE